MNHNLMKNAFTTVVVLCLVAQACVAEAASSLVASSKDTLQAEATAMLGRTISMLMK
ncbi:hypothetical protein ACFSKU_15785 [Pontibacter silvestris]|uniref:Uncharacterized protein n=1 Tax=Pontibacter silvestris TaxID=2305183 RepID=A0ABW4X2G4_9BACT|nr:hypothetical protein [Pontibacter silvestris]MCC9135930.1 hypothetical protein [Pontibacter silvestris]